MLLLDQDSLAFQQHIIEIQAGYTITVYEKDKKLGGLLRYGIPDFKLEKKYIERRIQILIKEGIHFITETEVGKDIEFDMLEKNYDAIILAIGAQNQGLMI